MIYLKSQDGDSFMKESKINETAGILAAVNTTDFQDNIAPNYKNSERTGILTALNSTDLILLLIRK